MNIDNFVTLNISHIELNDKQERNLVQHLNENIENAGFNEEDNTTIVSIKSIDITGRINPSTAEMNGTWGDKHVSSVGIFTTLQCQGEVEKNGNTEESWFILEGINMQQLLNIISS